MAYKYFKWCTFNEKYCEKTNMKMNSYNIREPYPLHLNTQV